MNLEQLVADAVRAQLADVLRSIPQGAAGIQAQVETVDAGGLTKDGLPLVTVSWQGQLIKVPYLTSYTPVVGHQVLGLIAGTDPVLLGRIGGTPAS